MIKSKKQMFLVISVFALVLMLGTVTYAFFNYTRTGTSNIIRVGRISFVSKNEQTINLTNLFPIDPTETGIMNDNTKVGTYTIDIEGDTDYIGGIEYLVTTTDAHIYTTEGKMVPVSIDVEVDDLGNENANYFTARNSKDTTMYKIMSAGSVVGEQQLVVGYIKPNTTSGTKEGVNGSITIKAYFDKNKIAITDTPEENIEWQEGRTVISTSEWNALQTNGISFQVKVEANEGIWVGEPFYEVMKRSTVMDNISSTYVSASTGIDFSKISGDTDNDGIDDNGKGIYTLSSTANDAYPIMYYRGDVDNNVLFGGFCWKVVRTTDTGGIKLIYNGNPVNNQCGNDRILEKNQVLEFWLEEWGETIVYFSDNYEYDSTNKVFRLTGNIISSTFSSENVNSLIGKYTCLGTSAEETCGNLIQMHSYVSEDYATIIQITQDSSIILGENDVNRDNIKFNLEEETVASVGYMYGTNYVLGSGYPQPDTINAYFGTSFTYENGTYKLINPVQFSDGSTLITNHYTCGLADPNGTCESIMYYTNFFRANRVNYYNYILLTNGKSVEDVLDEMFTNSNDSLAKTMIDTWYASNLIDYTNKLEDTIYCNDRSIYSLGGYNSNGGAVNSAGYSLWYSGAMRISNKPSLVCIQKNDAFTMSLEKGNGKLDYPVGMITSDEANLAGAIGGLANPDKSFYLYDGNGYWTMTPCVSQIISYVERVYVNGNLGGTRVDHTGYHSGFRPVISLKEGTSVASGTGTPTNPYVIE